MLVNVARTLGVAALACSVLAATAAHAAEAQDTVVLNDGTRLRGTISVEDPARGVTIVLADGSVRKFPAADVRRVVYGGGITGAARPEVPAPAPLPVAPVAPPPPDAPAPRVGVEEPGEEFHVGFRFSAGIGIGYAHYAESETGPNPGSFTLDGPGMPLPLLMAGVQITPKFALVGTAIFHPFYAVGGSFVPGGFAALGAVISPTRAFDLDLDFGGGGLGVGGVFGGQGPAGSVGATFYPIQSGHWSFGPAVRLTVLGMLVHYPGGNDGSGYLVSPTLGFTGTYR